MELSVPFSTYQIYLLINLFKQKRYMKSQYDLCHCFASPTTTHVSSLKTFIILAIIRFIDKEALSFHKVIYLFLKVVTCCFYDIISGDKINYTFWKIWLIVSRATKTSYTVTKWLFLQTLTLYMLCESRNVVLLSIFSRRINWCNWRYQTFQL